MLCSFQSVSEATIPVRHSTLATFERSLALHFDIVSNRFNSLWGMEMKRSHSLEFISLTSSTARNGFGAHVATYANSLGVTAIHPTLAAFSSGDLEFSFHGRSLVSNEDRNNNR